ncbi:Uncharacterised protein [Mycobacteroides abscessus subsp. massiliense]|nr:Uncharacterised protein [Mycobacteroides abscessus subsp. massiliense]
MPITEPGQLADIAGSHGVVDDPHHHEQRGLEQGVCAQHDQPGQQDIGITGSGEYHQKSELADRAEGQNQLEVVLPQRAPARQDHRRDTQDQDHRPPRGGLREPR